MSTEVVHRLGALVCGALVLGWPVRALGAARRERKVRRRLAELLALEKVPARRRFGFRAAGRRWLPVAGAVCAGWVLVGGLVGVAVGLLAGFGARWWRQRRGSAPVEEYDAARAARQLPLAADLVAACIAAGAGPVVAAQAVGEALGGPVGERLARGAAEVRLGGEPVEAWRRLASMPGAGALARLLERAGESGVPAAVPVGRLAAEARAEWGRAATARARRAAVMVTVPVGLCFLPAFLAIGVLPVVIGLADGVLGGVADDGRQRAVNGKRSTGVDLTGVEMFRTVCVRVRAWLRGRAVRKDAGMVTSEYAVGVVAAVAFAAVLYKVVTSGQVGAELQGIVGRALNVPM